MSAMPSAMPSAMLRRCIDNAAASIADAAPQLTALDRAIGDGDHGVNMRRGFAAVAERRDELAALPTHDALQQAGMTLLMNVGGASGPLYGSLLIALGKALPAGTQPGLNDLCKALADGVNAVAQRGRAAPGEKTMLDVLHPVSAALNDALKHGNAGDAAVLAETLCQVADDSLAATAPMRARKGRAAFLGARSVGHLDPGACSSALLVKAVCAALLSDAAR